MIKGVNGEDLKLYSNIILKLARDCEKHGRFKEAAVFYASFIQLYPNEPLVAHYNLARLNYKYLNHQRESLEALEKLIKLLGTEKKNYISNYICLDLAPIYHLKARVHLFFGQNDGAIQNEKLAETFIKGSNREELESSIHIVKAIAFSRKGDIKKAEKEIRISEKIKTDR